MKLITPFLALILLLFTSSRVFADQSDNNTIQCMDAEHKNSLLAGWYLWEPYQFNQVTAGGYKLTGMDIELVKSIADRLGIAVNYKQVNWNEHLEKIRLGQMDIAAGATYTPARAEFAYFSVPYRFEENSLFVMHDLDKVLKFDTISEYLAQVRLQNFRLGIIEGFIYADPQINLFISDDSNQDIVVKYKNDVESLAGLIRGEIDGFMADRVVGAAAVLQSKANSKINEIRLNIKTPIHLMFSKLAVPLSVVDRFNQEIRKFLDTPDYRKIVKAYLYPVMLLQTIDSTWFYLIGVIGTIAFAVSGVAIAAKDNTTLFGTFLFAMLPSVGGGVMRDVLINRDKVGIFLTPSYMYYILIVVLVGFFLVRLLYYYNSKASEDLLIVKLWDNILIVGDAIGQAAFIVTGVSIVIMARIEPIELWGPFFAFLTANGGGILRDLLRKKHKILCLSDAINAEVAVIWGLIFGIFLNINSHNPSPDSIRSAVIIVVLGAFTTRILAYYFKLPNIKFGADPVIVEKTDTLE